MEYIKKILDIAKSLLNIKKEYDNRIEYLSEDITTIDYGFNVILDETATLFEWNIQLQAGYCSKESLNSYMPLVDLDIKNREDYEAIKKQLKFALLSYLNMNKDEILQYMAAFLCNEAQYQNNKIKNEHYEVNRQIRELKEDIERSIICDEIPLRKYEKGVNFR